MPGKIFITGLGVTSAIGENVEQNLKSLIKQKTGISAIDILDTIHKNDYRVGEIKLTNKELAQQVSIAPGPNLPRTALLAIKAAKEAFYSAGLENTDNHNTGFVGSTTTGGMEKTEKYYFNPKLDSSFILSLSFGYISEYTAAFLGISGYLSTINTACSSSANAILAGARLIKHGIVDRVIAGGFDSLSKFTLNGFRTLFLLSPEICLPFDKNRHGLNLGEGAGFVVLESEESMLKRNVEPICELTGYANANDAFHQTASSSDGKGSFISMAKALKKADIKPAQIDYINVHGTGTKNNDLSEGIALKRIFGDNIPAFSSTKSFIGHTLGAAGGIEAVYSVLALRENLIYPNLFFKNTINELGISPVTDIITDRKINHVMSNSFGFGGNASTLIFSKV